jgi:glutathione peroxidase-family protein
VAKQQPTEQLAGDEIPFRDATGRKRTLREFRGQVLLIVNTASY